MMQRGFSMRGWVLRLYPILGLAISFENIIDILMEMVPAHFTIGLCECSSFAEFCKVINSAYSPMVIEVGNPVRLSSDNGTTTNTCLSS